MIVSYRKIGIAEELLRTNEVFGEVEEKPYVELELRLVVSWMEASFLVALQAFFFWFFFCDLVIPMCDVNVGAGMIMGSDWYWSGDDISKSISCDGVGISRSF